jgi:hypothetical protein
MLMQGRDHEPRIAGAFWRLEKARRRIACHLPELPEGTGLLANTLTLAPVSKTGRE